MSSSLLCKASLLWKASRRMLFSRMQCQNRPASTVSVLFLCILYSHISEFLASLSWNGFKLQLHALCLCGEICCQLQWSSYRACSVRKSVRTLYWVHVAGLKCERKAIRLRLCLCTMEDANTQSAEWSAEAILFFPSLLSISVVLPAPHNREGLLPMPGHLFC